MGDGGAAEMRHLWFLCLLLLELLHLGSGYGMLHIAFVVCPFPTSLNYRKIIGIIVSLIHLLTYLANR